MGAAGAIAAMQGVGLGTSLAGTALQMHGENIATQSKVQQDQVNQQLAAAQAGYAMQRGQFQANQIQTKGAQIIGQERAGYGASGVDANAGSAANVQATTTFNADRDAQMAMNNAARQAWGYQVTANQYGAQAGVDKELGRDQEIGTALGGAGQLASGVGGMFFPRTGVGGFGGGF